MTAIKNLRFAVLTDFHAYASRPDDKAPPPSWLDLTKSQTDPTLNPFAALLAAIRGDDTMKADLLLCCGDMGDKANPSGQQYVWCQVNRIKEAIGASAVLGAAGNHDVDSRHVYDDHDAKGQVQALEPLFPVADERKWLEYWARNFTTVNLGAVRIVLLNTAAYHGYAKKADEPEYLQGRVSDRTIVKLIEQLKRDGPSVANILVCHHHPFKNDKIASTDYSEMMNGDKLINNLVDAKMGPWLVVHGHKHTARVFQAPGNNAYPTIFAAASFAATPYTGQPQPHFNEFYIVDLEIPAELGTVTSLKGAIKTWMFSYGLGWRRPQVGEGLGPTVGFGARVDTGELAKDIAIYLKTSHAGLPVPWTTVAAQFPNVRYLVPDEFDLLLELLHDYHDMRFNRNFELKEIEVVQVP